MLTLRALRCLALASIATWHTPLVFAQPHPPRIGVISCMSGEYANLGTGIVQGVTLAFEEWKEQFPERHVQVRIEDDGFEAKKGVSAYRKLVTVDQVDAIINVSSITMSAISSLVRKDGLPTAQIFAEGQPARVDNIFQISPDYMQAEYEFGRKIAELYSGKITIISTGSQILSNFVKSFENGLGRNAHEFIMPLHNTDVRSLVRKASSGKPQVIVIIAEPSQGALVERELRALESKAVRAFDANFESGLETYKRQLGDLESLSNNWLLSLEVPQSVKREAFRAAYKKRFSAEPPEFAEYGYDAFFVLMLAQAPAKELWTMNVAAQDYEGVSGNLSFNSAGVAKPKFKIIKISEFLKNKTRSSPLD